jgi:hypothetical protein
MNMHKTIVEYKRGNIVQAIMQTKQQKNQYFNYRL